MAEIEVPIEKVQEDMHHAVHHGSSNKMMMWAALMSAFLAVFAAIAALLAGHESNEAMISQIKSSDQWAYYQAKGIKLALTEMRSENNPGNSALNEKIGKYKKDQEEIQAKARELENASEQHLKVHESLAASVTLFQVAIALTAIAVLTKKRRFLFVSSGLGALGILWLIKTLLMTRGH